MSYKTVSNIRLTALRRRPLRYVGLLMITLGLIASACGSAERPADRVHLLEWDGIVNPVMDRYIERGIDTAEKSQARAVVLQLDTPGGLDSSMRDIIKRINSSTVPVIVYVSPSGSRAASAGTFITMAGHVAAMAPNTTIGAASAVNADGSDIEGTMGDKVENDAVAYIRGIAELRGRNADWAEEAVRDAVAVNENKAVELKVVDFIASGIEDLLAKSDGRQVLVASDSQGATRTVTLRTAGAETIDNGPNIFEELLYIIASPDIAFLLFSLGSLALLSEIFHPSGFGAVVGVSSLVVAFFALGALPTNWAGVLLISFGFILIIAELFVTGFGILGIGGVVCLMLGGLMLTGSSEAPGFQVSRWLVFGVSGFIGAFFLLFVGALLKMRRMPSFSGRESLIGAKGLAKSDLRPRGVVWVAGERWEATAEDGPIDEDTPVIVTATEGLKLHVKRDPASIKLLPPGPEQADESPELEPLKA